MMVVQPYFDIVTGNINNDLVNIILKPISALEIPFETVKYYIYRGVAKSSLINGSNIVPASSSNTEFINKLWQRWGQFKIDTNQPNLQDPTPRSFGFDPNLQDVVFLEEIFNSGKSDDGTINSLQAIRVQEGEWIGNVLTGSKFSLEIIIDTDHLTLNLEYARKSKHLIDVSNMPSTTPEQKFAIKAETEKVLNFVDPAALFGMCYEIGVKISTYVGTVKSTTVKYKDDIYSGIIDKFLTKNTIYLDIRSERGYSYNFYNNYDFITSSSEGVKHQNIQFKGFSAPNYISQLYGWSANGENNPIWPIILYNFNDDRIQIKLRIDDNLKPLLFVENQKLLGANNKEKFITETKLLQNVTNGWTETINLTLPFVNQGSNNGNISQHVKLQYFRQEGNPNSPNTVFKNESFLDSVFNGIHFPLISIPTVFLNQRYSKRHFINGSNFSYVTEGTLLTDSDRVTFIAKNGYSLIKSTSTYPKLDFSAFETKKIIQNPILPQNILYNKWQVNDGTNNIDIIDIVGYNTVNTQAIPVEDIFLLGLTKSELNLLDNISGINNLHHKYVAFEIVSNQLDINTGIPYKKYKLKVQGINNVGNVVKYYPSTDVYVYAAGQNMFCSKDFALNVDLPNLLPDPGSFQEYDFFHRIDYDGNDSLVTNIYPTGIIDIRDNNFSPDNNLKVGVLGEIFYPVDSLGSTIISARKSIYPFVGIIHGNGQRYSDYRELAAHLAKNGFIVLSVSCLIQNEIEKFRLYPINEISNQLIFSRSYPANYYVAIDFQNLDSIYIYNNNPGNPINSNYAFQKLTVIKGEWVNQSGQPDTFNITNEYLLSWNKEIDFNINLNTGQVPAELIFLFKVGRHGMAPLGRANVFFSHLQIVKSHFGNKVENNIGILGHSRGGEAVVRVAKDISSSSAPSNLKSIKAIISLAPTDIWNIENLNQDIPYHVLYGSMDGDVAGYRKESAPNQTSGFSLYDRANNKTNKSMAFVYGATHNGFITNNSDYTNLNYFDFNKDLISVEVQKKIINAYVNAFFRANLRNENTWGAIFEEGKIPLSISSKNIFHQYKNMDPHNTDTIVDFQSGGNIGINSGQVSLNNDVTNLSEGNLIVLDKQTPHDTKGLLVKWKSNDFLTFHISTSGKDISSFNYISFRIGIIAKVSPKTSWTETILAYDSSGNINKDSIPYNNSVSKPYSSLKYMQIRLIDIIGNGNNTSIQLAGNIPEPHFRENAVNWNLCKFDNKGTIIKADDTQTYVHQNLTKSAMMTIRTPLSNYISSNVDFTKVKEIIILFPSSGSGELVIDDVQFSV